MLILIVPLMTLHQETPEETFSEALKYYCCRWSQSNLVLIYKGEEFRKQTGDAAYIECSLETHQNAMVVFDAAFKGVLQPPRRRELMSAREKN